jgi:hypothetical protein
VHLAVRLSRTTTIAALVEDLKTSSSKWLKSRSPDLGRFAWQRGYGVFSVSPKDGDALLAYIDGQPEHHKVRTFEDEYRALLSAPAWIMTSGTSGTDRCAGPSALGRRAVAFLGLRPRLVCEPGLWPSAEGCDRSGRSGGSGLATRRRSRERRTRELRPMS